MSPSLSDSSISLRRVSVCKDLPILEVNFFKLLISDISFGPNFTITLNNLCQTKYFYIPCSDHLRSRPCTSGVFKWSRRSEDSWNKFVKKLNIRSLKSPIHFQKACIFSSFLLQNWKMNNLFSVNNDLGLLNAKQIW